MSVRKSRLLLLVENPDLGGILQLALREYDLEWHPRPGPAGDALRRRSFDLAIVDLSFGGRATGIEVIRQWRATTADFPIIALSDLPQPSLAVDSLDAGADDFLRKPFHYGELLVRMKKLLARGGKKTLVRKAGGVMLGGAPFRFGGAVVQPDLMVQFPGGASARLRPKQHGILKHFSERAGALVLREELLGAVWGSDANEAGHSVNQYLSTLRQLFTKHGIDFRRLVVNEPKAGWRIHPGAAGPEPDV